MKNTAIAQTICAFFFTLAVLHASNKEVATSNVNSSIFYEINNSTSKTIVYDNSKGLVLDELNENLKRLDIFDKRGKKIMSINKFDKAIYLNSLRSGSYSIKIELKSGKIITKKLIKL